MNSGKVIWFTGLSGSGKSTLSCGLKQVLESRDTPVTLLDGDVLRRGLNSNLGFSQQDRAENIRRAGEIAKILCDTGQTVIAAFITPTEEIRRGIRQIFDPGQLIEFYVQCPLEICEQRDPKGLYKKARRGEIPDFTGISSAFEPPAFSDFTIATHLHSVEEAIELLTAFLDNHCPDLKRAKRTRKNTVPRTVVIGLDCAPADLVFGSLRDKLPNLRDLCDHGIWGPLRSTDPPITIPAWTTMTTGKDPGELGLYGFRNRNGDGYGMHIVDSRKVNAQRVWDYLEAEGLKSVLIGIPQTYPAKPHNGITIADFLAPNVDGEFTYPRDLATKLDVLAEGKYLADITGFRTNDKSALLNDIYSMAERRFRLAESLLTQSDWDFFMMVEMALDRLHHGFWRYFRTDHRFYDPENPYKEVIPEVYQHVDSCLGSLLARLDDDVTVIVVSDHGAKSMQGGICINEWLRMKGYLTLKCRPASPAALTYDNVDWRNTSAWSEGGYYGRIFVNVEGREPDGIVKPAAYEAFLAELSAELEAITDENGLQMKNSVHRPADLYREVTGSPPDLLVYFDDLSRRCVGTVGNGKIHVFENNTGPDDANHDFYGIFICAQMRNLRSGTKMGKQLEGLNLLDITPTILDLFGVPVPSNLGGRIIEPNAVIRDDKFDMGPIRISVDESGGLTSGEEAIIQQRLADLGYI